MDRKTTEGRATLEAAEKLEAINYQSAAAVLKNANRSHREAYRFADAVLEAAARKYNIARDSYLVAREALDAWRFYRA